MLVTLLVVSAVFSLLGSGAAFAIIYTEYQRHQLARHRLVGEALKAALVAFLVLFALSIFGSLLVSRLAR